MTYADVFESTTSLRNRLNTLRAEHQELNEHISHLSRQPPRDELTVPRLKKRRLILHDRIALIERLLDPDLPA